MQNKTKKHYQYLGQTVRALRQERGLSVRELSRETNIGKHMLIRMERGDLSPRMPVDALFRLAKYFSLDIRRLFKSP